MIERTTSAIVTINDVTNYGNRLQNYALEQILKQYSNCTTIHVDVGKDAPFLGLKYYLFVKYFKPLFHLIKRNLIKVIQLAFPTEKYLRTFRIERNWEFTQSVIPDNRFCVTLRSNLKSYSSELIQRIIIGSDQVWNYQWLSKEGLALRLGSFVPDDVPIISYAASFGVSEVSDDVRPIFQRYLPRLKAISVREDRGAELVKEMTGLDATVVLDPTLMLDMNQWNSITQGFVSDNDQYVLTYFLGNPSDEQEQAIQDYAKAHGCRVRRILDLRDKETYVAGPQDFVELFSKAQYVFTDSYHACCFSILYHKQFTVFNRAGMEGKANMNSRMETLFRLFDLDSVVMDKGLAPRIDYDKVDKLLARHRAESQAWLDKAMEA